MDRQSMPRYSDVKGSDFCRAPLSSSPFPPPPNCFGLRHTMPPRFASPPPGPLDAIPLCRPPVFDGFLYRSPIHSPSIPPVSPYGSRGPFCNSPFGVTGPNGTPSSGSSYGDHSGAGNFRQGGRKSWNGTPHNGNDMRRGLKRHTPSFRQVNCCTFLGYV